MTETSLLQMYRGGIFDHIGGGFSRYSTDPYFLVPHFEKMLYDNALLILAYCKAYQLTKKLIYCEIAEKTAEYVLRELTSTEGGFFCAQDADSEGVEKEGFFLYGEQNEQLILRPKETYDGAVPSGNSLMYYNLVRLGFLTDEKRFQDYAVRQQHFMSEEAKQYPAGYAMFLIALSDFTELPDKVIIVKSPKEEVPENLACRIPLSAVCIIKEPSAEYKLKNDKITYYVCRGHQCLPPVNDLASISDLQSLL